MTLLIGDLLLLVLDGGLVGGPIAPSNWLKGPISSGPWILNAVLGISQRLLYYCTPALTWYVALVITGPISVAVECGIIPAIVIQAILQTGSAFREPVRIPSSPYLRAASIVEIFAHSCFGIAIVVLVFR